MAIDTSIYQLARPQVELENPIQIATQMQQLRLQQANAAALNEQRQALAQQRQQQAAKLQQEQSDQHALDTAQQSGTDIDSITKSLTDQGYGHLVPAVRKQLADADAAGQAAREKRIAADSAETEYFGTLAAGVKAWAPMGPEAMQNAAQVAIQHAKAAGHDTSQIESLLGQNPQALPQVLDSLIAGAQKPGTASAPHVVGNALVDPSGKVLYQAPEKVEHSPAYKEWQDAVSTGYKGSFTQYQNEDANRKRPVTNISGLSGLYNQTDPKAIADGIASGELPPDLAKYGRVVQGAVATQLQARGFNLSSAQTDWTATQKHVATMNGAQQTRLNQAVNQLPDLLDSVETLAKQWKGGRFPPLNAIIIKAAKNGVYGQQAASIANQLDSQIADVTGDLATVYMGGNSPTDKGIDLAAKALRSNWDEKVLVDALSRARQNVQIRKNSIQNTGVQGASAGNPYAPAQAPQVPQAPSAPAGGGGFSVTAPNGKTYTFKSQADLDAFKQKAGIQ